VSISYPDLQKTPLAVAAGVYAPQEDSRLLVDAMEHAAVVTGQRVLDLCTGSGVAALAAARLGAATVTAWDICPRAVRCARENARSAGLDVEVRHGALIEALTHDRYDIVVSNPPYVPTPPDSEGEVTPPAAGPAWAWNAGADGRAVLDPLCQAAPDLLADRGTMLLVQSEFADIARSVRVLRSAGLIVNIVAWQWIPFGPVLNARASWLESTGRLPAGRRDEQLVVIRADKP
jgi:release factor glutamine methyltransferase